MKNMSGIPKHFCWTRFGAEAGQGIEKIIARKEAERIANGGLFLWGIGNAISPSIRKLLLVEPQPEVVFSPIKSKPRKEDVSPSQIVVWTRGRTLNGDMYDLPDGSIVTSRFQERSTKSGHYALVCASSSKLNVDSGGECFSFGELRNFVSGNRVGASQVTAVVRKSREDTGGPSYTVAMRTKLVYPYLVRLINPVSIPKRLFRHYSQGKEGSMLFDFARKSKKTI